MLQQVSIGRDCHIILLHYFIIVMPHVGEYSTSMEMAGMSISIFKLDEELEGLLADEAITPFYGILLSFSKKIS